MAVLWEKVVFAEKATASKFVALSSSSAAKMLNLYPQKGRIEEGSDADVVVWNPNNLRTVSIKETSESKADVNVFEGLSVHGAPEFVVANGRVVVYEYEINPNIDNVSYYLLPILGNFYYFWFVRFILSILMHLSLEFGPFW